MNAQISVKGLQKSFNGVKIFDDLSFSIEEHSITAIVGPNGCGKSTILNILSGLIKEDGGTFRIEDFKHYNFSYIFQNYRESLLPWRKNFENIALPLEIQNKPSREIKERVAGLQKMFKVKFDWGDFPYELSGGQQQMLAFMRALITKPNIIFVDEPFSALDYENNLRLRDHLQKYYLTYKPTIILITHNIEEAVHLAQKIIILSKKPTKVLKVIKNTLPYPRSLDCLKSERFNLIKDEVLSAFQEAANL